MRKLHYILLLAVLVLTGCEWSFKFNRDEGSAGSVVVERYDRIESLYLTTGDFSALQHMNTGYPMQTRTLIEDVLRIGRVNDPQINSKFLNFYQDTVLQCLITDVEYEYASMDDINRDLTSAFGRLKEELPDLDIPLVYAQIGSLDQSIIVGDGMLGISLDKYLGAEYPLYQKYYSDSQRKSMVRSMIVPDCLGFYLLSLYPMPHGGELSQLDRDMHMGKIQWVVNRVVRKPVFTSKYVAMVDLYMKRAGKTTVEQLLENNDYRGMIRR